VNAGRRSIVTLSGGGGGRASPVARHHRKCTHPESPARMKMLWIVIVLAI